MKLYRLPLVLREPGEDNEDKYVAEIPAMPSCRAWGDTAAEALENLQSVATAFIESYMSRGDPLPTEVETAASETTEPQLFGEVSVAI
jgi:predicted RNase H-like HicB family nuclease